MTVSLEEYDAATRTSLDVFIQRAFLELNPGGEFKHNWSLEALAFKLQQVGEGKNRRLIINVPPRSLKSFSTSVAFPAWLLGRDPSMRIIGISYGQDLAASFSHQTRQLMRTSLYQKLFPGTAISKDKDTESFFRTTQNGQLMGTSVGGPLTGLGGQLLILDDPLKADDAASETQRAKVIEWYRSTALSRLDDPKTGAIVVVMQRLHLDDLTGYLLEQGGWDVLRLPAIADETQTYELYDGGTHTFEVGTLLHEDRLGQKELDEFRRNLGTAQFSAQYLQSPIPGSGTIFRWEWFKYFDHQPGLGEFEYLIQSWDIATTQSPTSNWSVCTTWGVLGEKSYLIDLHRVRLEFVPLVREIEKLERQYEPDVIAIEAAGVGQAVFQNVRALFPMGRVWPSTPTKGKSERAEGTTPVVEAGNVLLPRKAAWLNDFRDEVRAFPAGKYDDQVDSMVQFLAYRRRLIAIAHEERRPKRSGMPSTAYAATINLEVITISGDRKDFLRRHDPIFASLS